MTHNKPRRRIRRWLLFIALFIVLGVAIAAVIFWRSTIAPQPSAFYTPPSPLPAGKPGMIIRQEPLMADLPKGAVAWRILYLSTSVNGEPIAVSGVVVAPKDPSTTPRPVIAWAHGTVGVLPKCGVSHTNHPYKQTPVVNLMVQQGFVVVATDYPGLGTPGVHPYLVGTVSAYSILDSVRAAQQLDINAGNQFAVWGASQGGQAALWAAQTVEDYAPELNLVATAASAPAINLAGIVKAEMESKGGGIFIAEALYAWSHHNSAANLDAIIKPDERAQFERMATTCVSTPSAFLTLGNILEPTEYLSANLLTTEPWRTIVETNTPREPLDAPLLITQGTVDTIIPITLNEAEAARRCKAGENVTFIRLPGVGHDARNESGIVTVGWLEDRFAGRPTGSTCGS